MTDSAIPVRVAIRIRPLSVKEETAGCQDILGLVPNRPQVTIKNSDKAFTYDYAFGQSSLQEEVFETSITPLINQLFKGYNATVLAYGQTGSGKTHSMGTCSSELTPLELEGVIPRAVREIFARMNNMQDYVFAVRIAFIELYKEQLYDLLSTQGRRKEDCAVDLREDPKVGVIISNLTEVPVSGLETTLKQLEIGSLKRVTAATAMNSVSSRSHAIFTLMIEGTRREVGEDDAGSADDIPSSIIAKFHLVDLAGSERAKKTQATGVRYKEGVSINLGLLALGNVISALGEEGKPRNHIPYRDSKLTRLLQDSLGGNSYTLMIACVSPADTNVEETLSTLRYADRARKIKNKPIINRDDKEKEIAMLRRELQELRSQLGKGGGDTIPKSFATITFDEKEEYSNLKERYSITVKENSELTLALCACQEEMAYINEKLILNESSGETMKNKLAELLAEAEDICSRSDAKDDIRAIIAKISDVVKAQKASEKTLLDHEQSRLDSEASSLSHHDNKDGEDDDDEEHHQTFDAAHALKQNALANQLASLNKMLAQKEQLASTMAINEGNIIEIKSKYEENIKSLESEMDSLMKEKDQLHQQLRAEPPAGKIAEQRRKRIQELEQAIQDLRKKVIDQERVIKMNEKNAAKVKQLADEIRNMKQQKVKLVKQMREDAENVRIWKQKKEREVIKLKQNERKQQFQITRMESLHTKQQNVLRRKMEEAVASNKRLRDVMEKQKAARKTSREGTVKGGLAGAAERMRNFVTQELDMVVSVKEATHSRLQLLEDRKTLTKQLNDLKKQSRMTMVSSERDALQQKATELQSELDLRNDQIADLQKQIMSVDQDKEKDGGKSWMDTSVSNMTEAKIALQYLFEKAAESMVAASATTTELKELRHLYDEAVKNTANLEEDISQMKLEHSDELDRASKEYEERVMILLSKLSNKDTEIKDSEIQKFSKLHEELLKMKEETEEKRKSSKREMKARKAEKEKTDKEADDRYTVDEYFEEDSDVEEEIYTDESDSDPDWYKTPLFRRIRKLREENNTKTNHTTTSTTDVSNVLKRKNDNKENDELDVTKEPPAKRVSNQGGGCNCKTGCKTNRCVCKKSNQECTEKCKCDSCHNKNLSDNNRDSEGGPHEMSSADNTAGTMSLLNETFDVSVMGGGKTFQVKRNRDENLAPNDDDRSPNPLPLSKRTLFFKSPSSLN